jgi:chorismate synthase
MFIDSAAEFLETREQNIVRCADPATAEEMIEFIDSIRKQGDTVGGKVSCHIIGAPVGLGDPVFDKLHADLGKAMLSINAVHGFEFGSGFSGSEMRGSEHNDIFIKNADGSVGTRTNFLAASRVVSAMVCLSSLRSPLNPLPPLCITSKR